MIRIIKIGGKLIENDAVLNGLCDELSATTGIVYWYMEGKYGRTVCAFGDQDRMIDGRRITGRKPGGCRDGLCRMGE
ncbi:MAG: hypothetical protein ACLU30_02460 [Odoribacter splanchnicus]